MALKLKAALGAACVLLASQAAMAQITLYEGERFRGRAVTLNGPTRNLDRMGLGDSAGSIIVDRGRWEVCEQPRFEGRCAVLRRGHYDSLRGSGLEWNVSSVRPANPNRRYDVEARVSEEPLYEYRRRPTERVYQVPVAWSRAVMGTPSQRCWVERQAVPMGNTSNPNVGGAIAGALIGGVLGHQVGGGSGRDAATAAGVVAGAAVGANSGNRGGTAYGTQDVQRCEQAASGPPQYYEVAYNFRGTEHRVQMAAPPSSHITVNERGEPRM